MAQMLVELSGTRIAPTTVDKVSVLQNFFLFVTDKLSRSVCLGQFFLSSLIFVNINTINMGKHWF